MPKTPERQREYVRGHYQRNRQYYIDKTLKRRNETQEVINEAKSKPCADCGIQYPLCVMDFDHLDRTTKLVDIGKLARKGWSLARVQQEIDKCEVVCANCHRIRTHIRT